MEYNIANAYDCTFDHPNNFPRYMDENKHVTTEAIKNIC